MHAPVYETPSLAASSVNLEPTLLQQLDAFQGGLPALAGLCHQRASPTGLPAWFCQWIIGLEFSWAPKSPVYLGLPFLFFSFLHDSLPRLVLVFIFHSLTQLSSLPLCPSVRPPHFQVGVETRLSHHQGLPQPDTALAFHSSVRTDASHLQDIPEILFCFIRM